MTTEQDTPEAPIHTAPIPRDDQCLNCGAKIRLIRTPVAERWMHIDPWAKFPNEVAATMWQHCRSTVAQPMSNEGQTR